MQEFKYINAGTPVKLSTLILSGDLNDSSILRLYDYDGTFITKGNWFQDPVLIYRACMGVATKPGTGLSVQFHFVP